MRSRHSAGSPKRSAEIHGAPIDDVQFHELGGIDTLVDICGVAVLVDSLGIERVVCSPLPYPRGLVSAAHGVLPVPAPATLRLLIGAPIVGVDLPRRARDADRSGARCHLRLRVRGAAAARARWVGYGAGTSDFPERPNVLRVVLGRTEPARVRPGHADRDEPRRPESRARARRGRALLRGRGARRLDRVGADEERPTGHRAVSARSPVGRAAGRRRNSRGDERAGRSRVATRSLRARPRGAVVSPSPAATSASRSDCWTDGSSTWRPSTTTAPLSPRRPAGQSRRSGPRRSRGSRLESPPDPWVQSP